jgi:hypothetical protein
MLNPQNYQKGFLIDDEWIGGVTELVTPTGDGGKVLYHAYAANYLTSATMVSQSFDSLESALGYINTLERNWTYERIGCGSGAHAGCSH